MEPKDGEAFVDITTQFVDSLSWITNNKVVKSDLFDLLDGTRAIEVGNKRLDTHGIALSDDDLKFDCTKPLSLEEVISIENRLLIALSSWLNNGSLPITVLSCRYIYALVLNYTSNPKHYSTLEKVSFEDGRISKSEACDTSSIEYLLTNKVLLSFACGICKFISFCINVGHNVLYEEEDLTTRSMDLNFLNEVSTAVIMRIIDETNNWIEKNIEVEDKALLIETNKVVLNMLRLESFLQISLNLFGDNTMSLKECEYIKESSEILEDLKLKLEKRTEVPKKTFSKFVQTDANNNNIPSELYEISHEKAYNSLSNLFSSTWEFLVSLSCLKDETQLENLMKFDMAYKVNDDYNVIARGLFQLFLVRDDKSIIGSRVDLTPLTMMLVNNVVGPNSEIFDFSKWHIQGTDEFVQDSTLKLQNELSILKGDLETGIFNDLSVAANNRCRQRQLISKSLLIWDTLQVNFEAFEVGVYENFKIGGDLEGGEISLAASSFVYYKKLDLMMECALSGFELDLYKDFEACSIYWYVSYLAQLAHEHLSARVDNILRSKINHIKVTLPKRIKKLKAGAKKTQLKEEHKKCTENLLPKLEKRLHYIRVYLSPSYEAFSHLADTFRTYIVLLSGFGFLDLLKGAKNSLASPEMLFNLRMKPWSSIGVPGVPSFAHYKSAVQVTDLTSPKNKTDARASISFVKKKFEDTKAKYSELLSRLEDPVIVDSFATNSHHDWYNMLLKTCIMYTLELSTLTKILDDETEQLSPENYILEISEGYHRYFPRIRITKK